MKRKWIDRLIFNMTKKPKRFQKVKDPPETILEKLLRPQDARQEQYNRWCRYQNGKSKRKTNSSQEAVSSQARNLTNLSYIAKRKQKKFDDKEQTDQSLIEELKQHEVKFSPDDVLFITRDKTGQIVWLEKGTPFAGLKHILYGNGSSPGHAKDFQEEHGVSTEEIVPHLKRIFSYGEVIYSRTVTRSGKEGFEKLYQHNGRYYLLSGLGSNGFIVSAYPINNSLAERLKQRYRR